jgi:hypothetical protein
MGLVLSVLFSLNFFSKTNIPQSLLDDEFLGFPLATIQSWVERIHHPELRDLCKGLIEIAPGL